MTMSTCNKISDETLTRFAFDDEAPPEALTHLADCAECSGRLEELRRVRATAAQLLPVAPPVRLVQELRSQAEAVAHRRRSRRLAFRWLVPAAAAAALVLLVVWVDRHPEQAPADTGVAGIAPLNLTSLETDLDLRLRDIGLPDEGVGADADDAPIPGPEADLEQMAVAPAVPDEMLSPAAWDEEEKSLDQLEVALVKLENDLGLEPAGDDPAKGE